MDSRTIFDETNKVWSGAGASLLPKFDPKQSLGSVVLSALSQFPDKIGQVRRCCYQIRFLFIFILFFFD